MWVPFLNIIALGPPSVPTMVVSLPIAPRLISSRTCIHMGMKRREWSTVMTTPLSSQAAMSLSASSQAGGEGLLAEYALHAGLGGFDAQHGVGVVARGDGEHVQVGLAQHRA